MCKSLLFLSVVQAATSPTKKSISAASGSRWPKYEQAMTASDDYPATFVNSDGVVLDKMAQNKEGHNAGLYHLYRTDGFTIAPTQTIGTPSANTDIPTIIIPNKDNNTNQQTFYETNKANLGKFVDTTNTANSTWVGQTAVGNIKDKLTYGNLYGAALTAKLDTNKATFVNWKHTYSILFPVSDGAASAALKVSAIKYRIILTNGTTTATGEYATEVGTHGIKKIWYQAVEPDFVLASFFQSNGDATDGTTWCKGDWYNSISSVNTKATVFARKGFGPKGKCTWQFHAADKANGPVIQLTQTMSVNMMIQVIEWYTATQVSDSVIDKTAAIAANAYIGRGTAYSTGVFFNPIKTVGEWDTTSASTKIKSVTALPGASDWEFSTTYSQNSALDKIPNSIGVARYYERDEGQDKDTERSVDSTWFFHAQDVYTKVTEGYNGLKATYDTKKKEYETAVEDRKKDPKKTLPTRPNMPSPPSDYSGPKLMLASQVEGTVSQNWNDQIKKMKGMEGMIATKGAVGSETYDVQEIAKTFSNRISYLAASGTNDKTKIDGVGATFGRLGQGINTSWEKGSSPFFWQKSDVAGNPGMQVSLLPEYKRESSQAGWNSWSMTDSDAPTIAYGVKKFATLASFEGPATPGKAEEIKDGASRIATATLLSAAVIASALY